MEKELDLKALLRQRNKNLNLEVQLKILMLIALIRTDFVISKAKVLNFHSHMEDNTYQHAVRNWFGMPPQELRGLYNKQFNKNVPLVTPWSVKNKKDGK